MSLFNAKLNVSADYIFNINDDKENFLESKQNLK